MYGLDLFSGIGGITKALEGYVRPIAYCENDRYAQAVLLSRMAKGELPNAAIWDDVRTLMGSMLPLSPDIIYGGFPCQDISVAGHGAGLAGERSGLFFEIARLVGELRPRFVFLENVSAITVRGSERVVGELCRLGYDCRWGVLSAADVGANHRRERWWLLAWAKSGRPRSILYESKTERSQNRHVVSGIGRRLSRVKEIIPDSDRAGRKEQRSAESDAAQHETVERGDWWLTEPNVGRVANGVPFRVDRLKGLGNAVVPAQAREAFERLMGLKLGRDME